MKVAVFTDGIYPYVIGGMQRHSFYLVKYLAKNHVYIDLYHTNKSNLDINKLAYFSEEEKKYINSIVIPFPDLSKLPGHYLRASYIYAEQLYNAFCNNKQVDFIYTKGFTGWYLLQKKAEGVNCPPVGVNFHGYEMFQKAASFKSWLEQILLFRTPVKYIINRADVIFSYGGKITNLIQGLINNKTAKICEIPTGIDESWLLPNYKKTEKLRKFIFVGRYERRKGIEELTDVLKELIEEYNFQFDFIGPITHEKQIKNSRISYLGSITNVEQIQRVLTAADILVCPSHSEGMPNVIVEGMSRGLAIIATNVGAVNSLVNDKNGWLIPSVDKIRLKMALIEAIEFTDEHINSKKEAALETIAGNFLWSHIVNRHISEMEKVIKAK